MASLSHSPSAGSGPVISLVIPVYNRPDDITQCLASLAPSLSCLAEVLVVDDGSPDGKTPDAVEAAIAALEAEGAVPGVVRLIRQANGGPGAARNTGVAAAQGDWIVFLDSDDLWLPWTGLAIFSALQQNPGLSAMFMDVLPFETVAELAQVVPGPSETLVFDSFFDLQARKPAVARLGGGYFAVRRDLFLATDGFVPHLRGAEDTDLFYRLGTMKAGPVLALRGPVPVAMRTSNTDSLTLNMAALSEGLYFLLDGRKNGRYAAAPQTKLDRSLADLMAFWIRTLLWGGWGREAYDLMLRRGALSLMLRNGQARAAAKLLAAPALAVIRPRNHRFRWRPRAS